MTGAKPATSARWTELIRLGSEAETGALAASVDGEIPVDVYRGQPYHYQIEDDAFLKRREEGPDL